MIKKIILLFLQFIGLCILLSGGIYLLQSFVDWVIKSNYGPLFFKCGMIVFGALFLLFFWHFWLNDGKFFEDK